MTFAKFFQVTRYMVIGLLALAAILLVLNCSTVYGSTATQFQTSRLASFFQEHAKAVTNFWSNQEKSQKESDERQKEFLQLDRRQRAHDRNRNDIDGKMMMEVLAG